MRLAPRRACSYRFSNFGMALKWTPSQILFVATAACTLLIGMPYLIAYYTPFAEQFQASLPFENNPTVQPETKPAPDAVQEVKEPKSDEELLKELLARAATPEKIVIITALNKAWAANNTMIDIFLESFSRGDNITNLLEHLVIIAMDQTAYDRCTLLHPHCYMLKTDGVDFGGEKSYMTEDFLKMMWERTKFLHHVLELGHSFIFSDGDVLWVRNPFDRFAQDADVQLSSDHFNGDPLSMKNSPNSGFVYTRSNNRTVAMYKYWYDARKWNPGKNDQMVLNTIVKEQAFLDLGVKIQYLGTVYFGGFCQESEDMDLVVTIHANCCVGLQNKIQDLSLVLDDWNMYRSQNTTSEGQEKPKKSKASWQAPKACLNSIWPNGQ